MLVKCIFLTSYLEAQTNRCPPPYHWLYRYLLEVNLRTNTPQSWQDRPFSVAQEGVLLNQSGSLWLLINRHKEPTARWPRFANPQRQGFAYLGAYLIPGRSFGKHAAGGEGKFHFSLAYLFRPGVVAVYSGVFDQAAYHDPRYVGKRWRGVAGYADQAYLAWQYGRWRFVLGRDYLLWGAGETGQLLFSDAARSLDQLRLGYEGDTFQYTFLVSQLDPMPVPASMRQNFRAVQANRYMSAMRIELKLQRRYYLAITHAILYGGPDAPPSLAFSTPTQFFHGSLVNYESSSLVDGGGNTFGTIDWDLYPGRAWEAYGQLLVDDVQIEKTGPGDLEPNELGMLVGFRKADPFALRRVTLGAEYVAIRNRTYKTAQFWEWWVFRNKPIGYYLGSDLDHLNGFIRYWPNAHLSLTLRSSRIRLGEGRMDEPWDEPWKSRTLAEGYSEPFPTGIVETGNRLGLEIFWLPRPGLFGLVHVAQVRTSNVDHEPGRNDRYWELSLQLGWEWSVSFPFR